jgi:hypothetical protein
MAYKSFNQRYPAFKWIFMFAVLLTLPLTVFSVQKVSTNTTQHAAATACTLLTDPSVNRYASCYKYYCPLGYAPIGGTCGNVTDAECCYGTLSPKLKTAPTGLTAKVTCNKGNASYSFTWQKSLNTSGHYVGEYNFYYFTNGDQYSVTSKLHLGLNSIGLGFSSASVKSVSWGVRAEDAAGIGPLSSVIATRNPCSVL